MISRIVTDAMWRKVTEEAEALIETYRADIGPFWRAKCDVLDSDDLLVTLNADEIVVGRGLDHALTAFRRVDVLKHKGMLNMPFTDGRPGVLTIRPRVLRDMREPPIQDSDALVAFWLYVLKLKDHDGTRGLARLFVYSIYPSWASPGYQAARLHNRKTS